MGKSKKPLRRLEGGRCSLSLSYPGFRSKSTAWKRRLDTGADEATTGPDPRTGSACLQHGGRNPADLTIAVLAWQVVSKLLPFIEAAGLKAKGG
jgi:hypothetical protein